ncbi:hypothetical protein NP493_1352g00030 [Ridgeia piscesae]|uniref:Uncharacterized protein n=1 Tax=Ridgeia piscesae TaxID=27915 RepID=A0AAD9NCY6_RIDPI|nr:hypothetical protein NP493_1352g00030 [Ridgeia piscesae]
MEPIVYDTVMNANRTGHWQCHERFSEKRVSSPGDDADLSMIDDFLPSGPKVVKMATRDNRLTEREALLLSSTAPSCSITC